MDIYGTSVSLSNGTSESFSLSIYIAKRNTVEGPHPTMSQSQYHSRLRKKVMAIPDNLEAETTVDGRNPAPPGM